MDDSLGDQMTLNPHTHLEDCSGRNGHCFCTHLDDNGWSSSHANALSCDGASRSTENNGFGHYCTSSGTFLTDCGSPFQIRNDNGTDQVGLEQDSASVAFTGQDLASLQQVIQIDHNYSYPDDLTKSRIIATTCEKSS